MRLRMLMSHSLAVSAWPALPGDSLRFVKAVSMRPMTSSSAASEMAGLPRYADNCTLWRSSSFSTSDFRSARAATSMISNMEASA